MTTKRTFFSYILGIPMLYGFTQNNQRPDNEAYLLQLAWAEYAKAWNPFCEKLNSGVFDAKLFNEVKKKFWNLGGCYK